MISITHPSLGINDIITFKLMKRLRGSLIAYPADEIINEEETIFNMSQKEAANIYCKLLLADNNEVITIINRERVELQTLLAEDENCPERCFIQEALDLLQLRENVVFGQLDVVAENIKSDASTIKGHGQKIENRERYESVSSESDYLVAENLNVVEDNLNTSQSRMHNNPPINKYSYFYQGKMCTYFTRF